MVFSRALSQVLGSRVIHSWVSNALSGIGQQIHHQSTAVAEEQVDPFSLVADELSLLTNRLRSMVVAEVPKLASAAEYFFKMGVEGKRFRPTVLLLMATALNVQIPRSAPQVDDDSLSGDLRTRQQCIAEITEMIHVSILSLCSDMMTRPSKLIVKYRVKIDFDGKVASLLHDDVLDDAETRRGIGSLNFVMGNKLAVLAGDFLLSRACVALASLKHTEVASLLATVVEHLVTGETMQMTTSSDERCRGIGDDYLKTHHDLQATPENWESNPMGCRRIIVSAASRTSPNTGGCFLFMDYYMQKTYYKTASLISNSCKAIALLAGHTAEVSVLAFDYGKNLGLAFQLIDDVLDFTGTSATLGKGSLSDIRHGIVTAPILYAMEEFPQLRTLVDRGFDDPVNVEIVEILARKVLNKPVKIQVGGRSVVNKDVTQLVEVRLKALADSFRAKVNQGLEHHMGLVMVTVV
ncbi:Solanesyl-diphosphate synthase 1, mitochondrial [Capsicum annuum]|nr:Solanesyl-diphosphate synthase 1, mitochondrial [Capsicum annuum]KAF3629759.1 Solanesyl-diphosphate synthase 1, mitochondrial [Capsicum annuum]